VLSVLSESTILAPVDDPTSPEDTTLVDRARRGDSAAYGMLWERHVASARTAAHAISPRLDTDDLVSEAFVAILSAIRSGGGPRGPFRPYMYAAIRNTAASWGRKPRDVQIDTFDDFPHLTSEDPSEEISHRMHVASVLHTLPPRWRTLLWYLEVEGMKPREVAPLLGLSPNAVSALRRRARAGLRRAWSEHGHLPPSYADMTMPPVGSGPGASISRATCR
jgi:RNA polymerase sigma factor (sigma-70 family)